MSSFFGELGDAYDTIATGAGEVLDAFGGLLGSDDADDVIVVDDADLLAGLGGALVPGGGGLPSLPADGYGAQSLAGAQQLVSAVLASPVAQSLLARALGWVFSPSPTYQGQGLTPAMLNIMFRELPTNMRKPLAQRLAGLDAPIGLSAAESKSFLMLWLYDGMRALNINDVSEIITEK